MRTYDSPNGQLIHSWASLLDSQTLNQALMTSRSQALAGPLVLMPDAHLGTGSTVGSVLLTEGIIPAAVGVDIGCGVSAYKTNIKRYDIDNRDAKRILIRIKETIPSGTGKAHTVTSNKARSFIKKRGWPSIRDDSRILKQFGTLGSGNHFAEVSEDEEGAVWILVHSGSRGIGNKLAQQHISIAKNLRQRVEHPDLSYLPPGSSQLSNYLSDMLWAQDYAYHQREAMMSLLLQAVTDTIGARDTVIVKMINCHHNYSEEIDSGLWLSRKGAIDAQHRSIGIIPGNMGASTYVVTGKGNTFAYNSAPHGAGRMISRGKARRELDLNAFISQMNDTVWDESNAEALIDEAPQAYKPIETVIEDSKDLVYTLTILKSFINYKGL